MQNDKEQVEILNVLNIQALYGLQQVPRLQLNKYSNLTHRAKRPNK